ncbi:DUF6297 family protein [Herbiconiux sp. CPCC 205716]|uniref:DUF6297 family protein n=1 Tax=Herbiconiux gentiana TaxID=2970912 RepID=A0ABT2GH66_9MICO|nr:DUF6297 family protein [Herbiconiux gentiana]MCS5715565.1 DUF6297 family protein [Herbiconiux gentiana]
MSGRVRAAIAVWRARSGRAVGQSSFDLYLGLMVALVAVVPVGRAVWLSASGHEGLAVLSSPDAPAAASLLATALWAGALLLGRERGPALRSPFLTHALASSAIPVATAFRGPVLRSGALIAAACTGAAMVVGASLLVAGLTDPVGVAVLAGAGLAVGVVAAVAWLIGQAAPRAAAVTAVVVGMLGGAAAVVPALRAVTPSGWVALAYPSAQAPGAPIALAALGLVAAVPVLMNTLRAGELTAQASRWSSATSYAAGLDFDIAAQLYRRRPQLGRGLVAVGAGRGRAGLFLVRDVVGAVRTPGRLAAGVLGLVLATALLALATAPAMPGWLLGAVAGVMAYAALGPLTDGIRHAADTAADLPLYGIGDTQLVASHLLFPALAALIAVAAGVAVVWLLTGVAPFAAAGPTALLAALALAGRLAAALKGPFPPVLLTPVPTAMGDPMAAVRLAWALDGVLLASAAGLAAALLTSVPLLAAGVAAATVVTVAYRWRHRR